MLRTLEKDGVIMKKNTTTKTKTGKSKKVVGFGFNKRFRHAEFLERVCEETMTKDFDAFVRKLSSVPGMKVIITAGALHNQESTSPIDIVIAGEKG